MRLVHDKLFINGRQFIPNTTNSQNNTWQNNRGYRKNSGTNTVTQLESENRRSFDQQPRYINNYRQQQNQNQSEGSWQHHKYTNPKTDWQSNKPRWLERRKFVSQRDKWEVPTSNPIETTSKLHDTPQRMGKKKATSPIDTEVTTKKQREWETENEHINPKQVNENDKNGEQSFLQPFKINDDSLSLLMPNQDVQLQMPVAVDSATLYYGPAKGHSEQTK